MSAVKPSQRSEPVDDIREEALHWVNKNNGCKANGGYDSPRISSELPDCSMPMTFDQYTYCGLGCLYCFAYYFKVNNPAITTVRLGSVPVDRMIKNMQGVDLGHGKSRTMYDCFYKRKFLLHWGGLADPFCQFERENRVGKKLMDALAEMNYPTLFSFKGGTIWDYEKFLAKWADQRNFAFQISMVTADDTLAKELEVGVPSPTRRFQAMKMLSDMGYWTILRWRPFIIGISDIHLDKMLENALKSGAKGISMEFFALDSRSTEGMRKRFNWIGKMIGTDDINRYFRTLSPSERGGYMRLNRHVKERHVRKIYQFCVNNGLVLGISDPDFKELNMSGSCCAMPDKYKPNPLLTNWTRSQLTYHLKEARRLFHRTGECKVLKFGEVYGNEPYLDEPSLAQDHVSVIGKDYAERTTLTQRLITLNQWNNLNSPACPRNYFHGKVMPCRECDAEGNLQFKYTPSDYEARWKAEGVNMER